MTRFRNAAIVLAALAAWSCAVNPVTGQRELMLYSESQEIELGRQTDVEVAATYGVYDDKELASYVSRIGLALAAKTQRPGLPYRFAVLDSPVVNAFAVPGGSVYVTRGILAMISSEAELAAVLGHELGHVNARHSMRRMSQQQLAQLGLAVGSVISKDFARYAGLAGAGLQVLFLKYSRDDENQADELGVAYARAGGYDPADMAVTFMALQKMGDLSGGGSLPGFLSTHPLTSDRIAHVQNLLKPEDKGLVRGSEAYLRRIENIVYGEDPRQGYVEGEAFYHPVLRFQFSVPAGWKVENTAAQVLLLAADENGGVILRGAKTADTAESFAKKQAAGITEAGGRLLSESRRTINGLAGYEQSYAVAQQGGAAVRMGLTCLKKGDWVYAFQSISPEASYQKYLPDFGRIVGSFRELTDASKIDRAPKRLALVKASGRDSLRTIFQRAGMAEGSWPQFAVWNGLEASAVPPAGKLVKIVK